MAEYGSFPTYQVAFDSEIEGDEDRFTLEVCVAGSRWGRGTGRSKRQAEQRAATEAYAEREKLVVRADG